MKKVFDIRNSNVALKTLCNLTGVSKNIWEQFVGTEREYQYTDDLVEYVVDTYGEMPQNYRDWEFVYIHITTSANNCVCFHKYGILDLQESYLCEDSELRAFLEQNNIYIDLHKCNLIYKDKNYDMRCLLLCRFCAYKMPIKRR